MKTKTTLLKEWGEKQENFQKWELAPQQKQKQRELDSTSWKKISWKMKPSNQINMKGLWCRISGMWWSWRSTGPALTFSGFGLTESTCEINRQLCKANPHHRCSKEIQAAAPPCHLINCTRLEIEEKQHDSVSDVKVHTVQGGGLSSVYQQVPNSWASWPISQIKKHFIGSHL